MVVHKEKKGIGPTYDTMQLLPMTRFTGIYNLLAGEWVVHPKVTLVKGTILCLYLYRYKQLLDLYFYNKQL